nr:helix-turn-helix domain-containing protein [Cohnella kolymensis]
MRHTWPGNVRELQNVLERSIHLADGDELGMEDLPPILTEEIESESSRAQPNLLEKELEKTELRVIKQVLKECGGNRNKTAKLLGIHRASLYRKLEKHRLL